MTEKKRSNFFFQKHVSTIFVTKGKNFTARLDHPLYYECNN